MTKIQLLALFLLISGDMWSVVFAPPGGGGRGRGERNDNGRGRDRNNDYYGDADTDNGSTRTSVKPVADGSEQSQNHNSDNDDYGSHGRFPPPRKGPDDNRPPNPRRGNDDDGEATTRPQTPTTTTSPDVVDTSPEEPTHRKRPPPNKDQAFANIPKPETRSLLGMSDSPAETIVETDNQVTLSDGSTMIRNEHRINNMPVWNSGATTVRRNSGIRAMVISSTKNPDSDVVLKYTRSLGLSRAMPVATDSHETCRTYHQGLFRKNMNVTFESTRFVYDRGTNASDPNDVVYADLVNMRAKNSARNRNGTVLYYRCLVDTKNNKVVLTWSGIQDSWEGGNTKTGRYTYDGSSKPSLVNLLTRLSASSTTCKLASTDSSIQVFNMNSGDSDITSNSAPYQFTCTTGPTDGNSRGYGPLADSFYNAMKARDMYKASDWGGLSKITPTGTLKFGVHVQQGYDNAYWDGSALYFGDGSSYFLPLGTCLDVVTHEIGHAVTDFNSALVYTGEAGCLNEAFSDAMGEMAEYYSTGTNDWCIAKYCMVGGGCLRDMTKYVQYSSFFPRCSSGGTACQDPHQCSAVVNYMFYKLATSPGWNTKLAGKAFMLANRLFWQQQTTIYQAGCDVASAVKQANLNGGDTWAVINAWKAGGRDITNCVSNPSSGSGGSGGSSTTTTTSRVTTTTPRVTTRPTTTKPPGSTTSNPIKITNCDSITGASAPPGSNRYYVVYAPYGSKTENVQIYGDNGDADLYVRVSQAPTLDTYDWAPYWTGSDEWVVESITQSGVNYYIMVNGAEAYTNLEVYACFY